MKRMSVKKEVLVMIMIVMAVLTISSKVLATGAGDNPIQIPLINTTTDPATQQPTTNTETNTTAPTTNTVTPVTNTTGSTYQNTTSLPQTGDASDYAIFLLIAVAVVVAIYAYKKVREYNIK